MGSFLDQSEIPYITTHIADDLYRSPLYEEIQNKPAFNQLYLNTNKNLGDLNDVSQARDNLSLGELSVLDTIDVSHIEDISGNYLHQDDNLSDVSDVASARSNLGLGDLSVLDTTYLVNNYLQQSNNLNDVSDVASARSNINLGTNDAPFFKGLSVGSQDMDVKQWLYFNNDQLKIGDSNADGGFLEFTNTNDTDYGIVHGDNGIIYMQGGSHVEIGSYLDMRYNKIKHASEVSVEKLSNTQAQNNILFGAPVNMQNNNLTNIGRLTNTGGAKLEIHNGNIGGSSQGIFMWQSDVTVDGIYMASSGSGQSLKDGTATAGHNFSSQAIRFRTEDGTDQGFIFENDNEERVMSLNAGDKSMFVDGKITNKGGSKLLINSDKGSSEGIYLNKYNDTNWGIYKASGGSNSLDDGNAVSGHNFGSNIVRFRSYNSTGDGFVFENHAEERVMSMNAGDKSADFVGQVSFQDKLYCDKGGRVAQFDNPADGYSEIRFKSGNNPSSDRATITYYDDFRSYGSSNENSALVIDAQNDGTSHVNEEDRLYLRARGDIVMETEKKIHVNNNVEIAKNVELNQWCYMNNQQVRVGDRDNDGKYAELTNLNDSTWGFIHQDNGDVRLKGSNRIKVEKKLENYNGAKLEIQNGSNGGTGHGIFMWQSNRSDWTMYMASDGKTSINGGTTCQHHNGSGYAIRFCADKNGTGNGFIFENHNDERVMSIDSDDKSMDVVGTIKGSGNSNNPSGSYAIEANGDIYIGEGGNSARKIWWDNNSDRYHHIGYGEPSFDNTNWYMNFVGNDNEGFVWSLPSSSNNRNEQMTLTGSGSPRGKKLLLSCKLDMNDNNIDYVGQWVHMNNQQIRVGDRNNDGTYAELTNNNDSEWGFLHQKNGDIRMRGSGKIRLQNNIQVEGQLDMNYYDIDDVGQWVYFNDVIRVGDRDKNGNYAELTNTNDSTWGFIHQNNGDIRLNGSNNIRLQNNIQAENKLYMNDNDIDSVDNLNVSSINSNNGSDPIQITQRMDFNNNTLENVDTIDFRNGATFNYTRVNDRLYLNLRNNGDNRAGFYFENFSNTSGTFNINHRYGGGRGIALHNPAGDIRLVADYGGSTVETDSGTDFKCTGNKSCSLKDFDNDRKVLYCCVESNRGGRFIFDYTVDIDDSCETTIELPDYFTWSCCDSQVIVQPNKHFGIGYGEVIDWCGSKPPTPGECGGKAQITVNQKGQYYIMIIGTRDREFKDIEELDENPEAYEENKQR